MRAQEAREAPVPLFLIIWPAVSKGARKVTSIQAVFTRYDLLRKTRSVS